MVNGSSHTQNKGQTDRETDDRATINIDSCQIKSIYAAFTQRETLKHTHQERRIQSSK